MEIDDDKLIYEINNEYNNYIFQKKETEFNLIQKQQFVIKVSLNLIRIY